METIYTSAFSNVTFDKNTLLFKVTWLDKALLNEDFKAHVLVFSEKALLHKPKGIFVDARLHKYTVPAEIQKWHDETIIPSYIKAGIKKIAFLTPASIFAELTTKKIFQQDKAKLVLPTEFFKDENEALKWLNS